MCQNTASSEGLLEITSDNWVKMPRSWFSEVQAEMACIYFDKCFKLFFDLI